MTLVLKHKFQSLKVDGGDTSLIRPSNWNDDHNLEGSAWSIPFRNAATAGAMADIGIGEGLYYDTTGGKLDVNLTGLAGFFFLAPARTAPIGWLKANGSQVSRTTYANLFNKIGTDFGAGNGTTTFTLPDLRGLFLRAMDEGRGVDAGRAYGSLQGGQNSSHTHGAYSGVQSNDHTHGFSGNTGTESVFHTHGIYSLSQTNISHDSTSEGDYTMQPNMNTNSGNQNQLHYHPFSGTTGGISAVHTHAIVVNADGGNETRPINFALLGCIKY